MMPESRDLNSRNMSLVMASSRHLRSCSLYQVVGSLALSANIQAKFITCGLGQKYSVAWKMRIAVSVPSENTTSVRELA
jgi:hypothetical protein